MSPRVRAMRKQRVVAIAVIAGQLVSLGACTEVTRIQSVPAGAKATCNGQDIGLTPALYRVPESEFKKGDFRCRVEYPGYVPQEKDLDKVVAGGRIAGSILSLFIPLMFRGFKVFAKVHDFYLVPKMTADGMPAGPADPNTGTPLSLEERVERIRKTKASKNPVEGQ